MKSFLGTVPKCVGENRQYRLDAVRHAAGSAEARRYLWDICRADVLFYFNVFYWTFDPRLSGEKVVPFVTYPFQDWAVRRIEAAIHHGHDLVIEKSRDVGASWMCMGVFEHRWHFLRDQTFLCISRDEDEVDAPGRPGCLFAKVDFLHRHMPPWLMPRGYPGKGKRQYRSRLMFENPETGSTINGEATVKAAGVGDRKTAVLVDEFSRIDKGDEIDLGTADTTNCRIFNFTAYGEGNAADRLRRSPHKKKLRLVWWMDPRKNQKLYQWDGESQRFKYLRCNERMELEETTPHEYGPEDDDALNVAEGAVPKKFVMEPDGRVRSPVYDREFTRRGNPRWMAINWDIDYAGADDKFFDMALIRELESEYARAAVWEGEVSVDEGTGEFLGLVEKAGGPLKLWCRLDVSGRPPASELGYGGGVDVSHGRGATNSCLSVGDAQTGEKVAEYVTPYLPPERFAVRVAALGRIFASGYGVPMLLAWESLGPGEVFKDKVLELNYAEVYKTGGKVFRKFGGTRVNPAQLGWRPSAQARALLFEEYEAALRSRRFVNRSSLALRECGEFLRSGPGCYYRTVGASGRKKNVATADPSGASENHGDRVTADALLNRAMAELGRPAFGSESAREEEPADVYGSFAWRLREGKRADQRRDRLWG